MGALTLTPRGALAEEGGEEVCEALEAKDVCTPLLHLLPRDREEGRSPN